MPEETIISVEELERLRGLEAMVHGFLAQKGDDHCWKDWLVDVAEYLGIRPDPALLDRRVMRDNCERFCDAYYEGREHEYAKAATTAEAICELLNEMFRLDPAATTCMLAARVPCNEALAAHPTIGVQEAPAAGGKFLRVGPLGVLNGLCSASGRMVVGVVRPEEGEILQELLGFEVRDLASLVSTWVDDARAAAGGAK